MSNNETKKQGLSIFFDEAEDNKVYRVLGTPQDWHTEEAGDIWYFVLNGNLKNLRIENGLTQDEVAKVLNISQREYWRIEQEGYKIPPIRLWYLAIFYNVSLDYLFGIICEKRKICDGSNSVNGYNLDEMKKAKAEGREYIPEHKPLSSNPELTQELQAEIDEDNAEFARLKKEAGITEE